MISKRSHSPDNQIMLCACIRVPLSGTADLTWSGLNGN